MALLAFAAGSGLPARRRRCSSGTFLLTGIRTLDMVAEGAFLRSIYGFSAGVVAYHAYLWLREWGWQK